MGVGSSDVLPWLIPLTIASFLSYGIIYSQELFNPQGDLLDTISGIFGLLTFSGANLPVWLSFVFGFAIYLPWAYVIYDLVNEGVPG